MKYFTLFSRFSAALTLIAAPLCNVQAQAPPVIWQHCYGGDSTDVINCVKQTPDGSFIATGFTRSTNGDLASNGGVKGLWVLKLDGAGAILWEKTYNDTLANGAYIEPTYDGGFIVTGPKTVKLRSDGSIQWVSNISGLTIHQTRDSGYILSDEYAPLLTKLNADGSMAWQQNYASSSLIGFSDVCESSTTGFILGGEIEDIHPSPAYGKTDNTGHLTLPVVSIIEHGSGGPLCKTSDGDYLFADNMLSGGFNITKFDDNLVTQWHLSTGSGAASGIAETADNGVVAWIGSNLVSGVNMALVKFNSTHAVSWTYTFPGTSVDATHNVIQASDGNFVVAASLSGNDTTTVGAHGGADGWLAMFGFDEKVQQVQSAADVKVYPIPAGNEVHVSLPEGLRTATIRLLDVSGSLVASDNNSSLLRNINLSHLPAGAYVLEVSGKGSTSTYKVTHY